MHLPNILTRIYPIFLWDRDKLMGTFKEPKTMEQYLELISKVTYHVNFMHLFLIGKDSLISAAQSVL